MVSLRHLMELVLFSGGILNVTMQGSYNNHWFYVWGPENSAFFFNLLYFCHNGTQIWKDFLDNINHVVFVCSISSLLCANVVQNSFTINYIYCLKIIEVSNHQLGWNSWKMLFYRFVTHFQHPIALQEVHGKNKCASFYDILWYERHSDLWCIKSWKTASKAFWHMPKIPPFRRKLFASTSGSQKGKYFVEVWSHRFNYS